MPGVDPIVKVTADDHGDAATVYLTPNQARELRDALTAAINAGTTTPAERKPV